MLTDQWRTSSRSGGNGCVSARLADPGTVAVRDAKNPTGPALTFAVGQWAAFIEAVKGAGL